MKKVLLLVAALMGQMVAASDVDLYRGLLFWIKSHNNIEGDGLRKTTYPLSQVFEVSFSTSVNGRRSCHVPIDTASRPQYILRKTF